MCVINQQCIEDFNLSPQTPQEPMLQCSVLDPGQMYQWEWASFECDQDQDQVQTKTKTKTKYKLGHVPSVL